MTEKHCLKHRDLSFFANCGKLSLKVKHAKNIHVHYYFSLNVPQIHQSSLFAPSPSSNKVTWWFFNVLILFLFFPMIISMCRLVKLDHFIIFLPWFSLFTIPSLFVLQMLLIEYYYIRELQYLQHINLPFPSNNPIFCDISQSCCLTISRVSLYRSLDIHNGLHQNLIHL